jgi:hypothetical protein
MKIVAQNYSSTPVISDVILKILFSAEYWYSNPQVQIGILLTTVPFENVQRKIFAPQVDANQKNPKMHIR